MVCTLRNGFIYRYDNVSERHYPKYLEDLAHHIEQPQFPSVLRRFLWGELNPDSDYSPANIPLANCPNFSGKILVHHSAVARFFQVIYVVLEGCTVSAFDATEIG